MENYNILILSAGRRVELIQSFQAAAERLGIKSKIVAGDMSESAPALYFADKKVQLPAIQSENYIDEIIRISREEAIRLIIPTIDTDLLLLSQEKNHIYNESGAKVLISDEQVISICRDKIETHHYLKENGFLVPDLYDTKKLNVDALEYPLFIKPKDGSSSINAFKVENSSDLENYMKLIDNPMVQSFMEGPEYTVDLFNDFDGNVVTIVPRLRVATRSGEISKGKIVKDREIINDIKKLAEKLKPIGPVTVQIIKTDRGIEYVEINPRFGGGAPMGIKSGADSCEHIYRLLSGEKLDYNEDYQDKLFFLRYDQSIVASD